MRLRSRDLGFNKPLTQLLKRTDLDKAMGG